MNNVSDEDKVGLEGEDSRPYTKMLRIGELVTINGGGNLHRVVKRSDSGGVIYDMIDPSTQKVAALKAARFVMANVVLSEYCDTEYADVELALTALLLETESPL